MTPALQNKVFTNLHISREDLLSEMTLLLIKQQLADYRMEVDFFEKKYDKRFVDFDIEFHKNTVSFEQEDDWLAWKFASESQNYWHDLLRQAQG